MCHIQDDLFLLSDYRCEVPTYTVGLDWSAQIMKRPKREALSLSADVLWGDSEADGGPLYCWLSVC